MTILGQTSEILYRALELTDQWLALPGKLGRSLEFRMNWRSFLPPAHAQPRPTLWFHGASVGELEDVAAFFSSPDLVARTSFRPDDLVLTASSVSASAALESFRAKLPARYIGPLPPEKLSDIREFLARLNPALLVMSHTDFWPRLLERTLQEPGLRMIWLPNRSESGGRLATRLLQGKAVTIGLKNEGDTLSHRFRPPLPEKFTGNLRLDRILRRIELARSTSEHVLERHGGEPRKSHLALIIGSAWPEDAEFLARSFELLAPEERARLQVVLLPHETKDSYLIGQLKSLLPETRIVAVQGILLEAYRNFDFAWVGGGFKTGLHNLLEAAAWGIPVFCGPDVRKQTDARHLQRLGVVEPFSQPEAFAERLRGGLDPLLRAQSRERAARAASSLEASRGASLRLTEMIACQEIGSLKS